MHKTHADLAADGGSSREVVSRILRDMAHRGLVVSSRGNIEIINKEAVIELSKQ
jgi:CRP-like cAMP-binding protein